MSWPQGAWRVVLFRTTDARIAALVDRCPHRGVALSLGKVTREGALACPFHGWQFDERGACLRVPLNREAKCERLGATPLPVRELGGLIWLYTAPGFSTREEPSAPTTLTESGFRRFYLVSHWRAHWTRAMENMLDMPHVPFVHRRTIGFAMSRRLRPGSELAVSWTPTENGGRIESTLDGKTQPGGLAFQRPNGMTLNIPIPGKRMYIHVYCVPVGPRDTRMIIISVRNFGLWNPLVRLFDQVNRLIVLEDQAIVESSDPPEVPAAAQERSVSSDRPTLQFRKYYFDFLRSSSARMSTQAESLSGCS